MSEAATAVACHKLQHSLTIGSAVESVVQLGDSHMVAKEANLVTKVDAIPLHELNQPSPFCFSLGADIVKVFTNAKLEDTVSCNVSPPVPCAPEPTLKDFANDDDPCNKTTDTTGLFDTSLLNSSGFIGGLASHASCPPHGVKAVCGKRSKMEDAYAVHPNFYDLPLSPVADEMHNKLPNRIALQFDPPDANAQSVPCSPIAACAQRVGSDQDHGLGVASNGPDSGNDTLHFFAVYDGHGGIEAAQHCANRLHLHLSDALANVCKDLNAEGAAPLYDSSGKHACQGAWKICENGMVVKALVGNISRSPEPTEGGCSPVSSGAVDNPNSTCKPLCSPSSEGLQNEHEFNSSDYTSTSNSSDSSRSDDHNVSNLLEEALKEAFIKTDAEFAKDCSSAMVGSTAVVALVGKKRLWIGNCGDSRAVLCRNSRAIQLTDDHKPEREDEAERVEKAGGQVLYWNGHRVMGVLAMSRAIGDHGLRPYVIPEPEISVVARTEDDDLLLLASDGLWDVMSNQEAANLAMRCLRRARDKGASRKASVRIAASVLTKAAVDRGSKDNVTVVIVDLKTGAEEATESAVEPSNPATDVCSSLKTPEISQSIDLQVPDEPPCETPRL